MRPRRLIGRTDALMTVVRLVLAIALLLCATYVAVMNWGCALASIRNKRRGIDRHHSTVPLVSIILTILAAAIYPRAGALWMIVVPLFDIGTWQLVAAAFRRRPLARRSY